MSKNSEFVVSIVLGLDGDEVFRSEVIKLLPDSYNIQWVDDSEDAYHAIHVFKPEIAVLDYSLGSIHPIELHEGVALAHPQVRFVICVTEENYQVAHKVWNRRASDFIVKPYSALQFAIGLNKNVRLMLYEKEINVLKNGSDTA